MADPVVEQLSTTGLSEYKPVGACTNGRYRLIASASKVHRVSDACSIPGLSLSLSLSLMVQRRSRT